MRSFHANALLPFLSFTLFSSWLTAQAQEDCCAQTSCRERAVAIADALTSIMKRLGPFPQQPPTLVEIYDATASTVGGLSKRDLIQAHQAVMQSNRDPTLEACIQSNIDDADVSSWIIHFDAFNTATPNLPSPNFARGGALFTTLNVVGVSDLYKTSERFSALYGIRYGRTWRSNKADLERHFRWLIGPSVLYQGNKVYFIVSPAVEYRITDIAINPVNIGSLKTHVQAHSDGDDIFMIDTGLAFETYTFGINLLSIGYQSHPAHYYLHAGFFINVTDLVDKVKNKRSRNKMQ